MRMISEGSCDTEGWSNDAENTALIKAINYILKYISIILNCNTSQHCIFFYSFDQINAGLMSIRDLFKKNSKE